MQAQKLRQLACVTLRHDEASNVWKGMVDDGEAIARIDGSLRRHYS